VTITLPLRSERPPLVRVLVATSFNNTRTGGSQLGGKGPWNVQPMLSSDRAGLELLDGLTRPCLPEIGECTLRMRFGVVDGRVIGLSASAMQSIQQSGSWNGDSDQLAVPSLAGKEIRVQLAPDDGSGSPAWRTVWWGQCIYEADNEWPAALIPAGERIYTCRDGLHRLQYWYLTRHAAYVAGSFYDGAPGHPGYNVGLNGKVLGNREASGAAWNDDALATDCDAKFYYHTWQGTGAATTWSDLQAAEHAMRVSRPTGEPLLSFSGTTALLTTGASPWTVDERETAWDFLLRVCARERGRGLVKLDWADDSADPTGPLVPTLVVWPQTYLPVTYIDNPTTGHESTIAGALGAGTTVAVELFGDHRGIPEGFTRANRTMSRFGAVETVGERIQVLITASRYDGTSLSLEDRWSDDDATAFIALEYLERVDEAWRQVYQAYGLPRTWQGLAKDHNNGGEVAQHRVDYRCDDSGAIVSFTAQDEQGETIPVSFNTSPLLVRILPDTPLLEGYVYDSAAPARRDGAPETGEPDRRPPCAWLRMGDDLYRRGELAGVSLQVKQDSIMVFDPNDLGAGSRVISDTSEELGATYNTADLGITLALELPHRLRFRTVSANANAQGLGIKNTKYITIPEAHLWLASPGAMWDVDGTTIDSNGDAYGRRFACGATVDAPGILRDDRARVAVLHALACAWYLQDHLPCEWAIRGCGLLPSFGIVADNSNQIDPSGTVTYPVLGQFVTTLAANGQTVTVNVPLTGIIYNHQDQTSRFSCDWIDLDVARG
jgi:hypothetical protein